MPNSNSLFKGLTREWYRKIVRRGDATRRAYHGILSLSSPDREPDILCIRCVGTLVQDLIGGSTSTLNPWRTSELFGFQQSTSLRICNTLLITANSVYIVETFQHGTNNVSMF